MKRVIPITDVLATAMMILFLLSVYEGINDVSSCSVPFMMSGIYFVTRLAVMMFPGKVSDIFLICVIVAVCAEILTGFSQIVLKNGFLAYTLKGSFSHSALLAGFLAICIPVLLAASSLSESKSIKMISVYVSLPAFLIVPATLSRAALLALAISCAVLYRFRIKEWIMVKKRYLIFIPVMLLCMVLYFAKKTSADGRLYLDRISTRTMNSGNILGAGLGNFEIEFGHEQTRYLESRLFNGDNGVELNPVYEKERLLADCPNVSYNEYLQIGVEAGPLAMALFMAILAVSIISAVRDNRIWGYGLLSFAVFAFFSYPFYCLEFQILIPVITALCNSSESACRKPNSIIAACSFLCALSMAMVVLCIPRISMQNKMKEVWKDINPLYEGGHIGIAVGEFEKIDNIEDYPAACLFAYGHSLNQIGEFKKSDSILALGAEKSSDPMFWNIMGNNSVGLGNYDEAEQLYIHAFHMIPNRLYPLYLLARLYDAECDTARFLDMAERVETFKPKVESIRTERLRAEILEIKSGY